MFLSKNIRYLRKEKQWSQEYIAEKLGYKSYTTIQKWEMGISEPPLKKLKELSILFDVDMNDLANKNLEADFCQENTRTDYQVLTDDEVLLIECYRNSDSTIKAMIQKMLS